MYKCRSCLVDCLRAVVGDSLPSAEVRAYRAAQRLPLRKRSATSIRSYATALTRPDEYSFAKEQNRQEKGPFKPYDKPIRAPHAITRTIRNDLDAPTSRKLERDLSQELRYLKDPLKLAGHVRFTLRSNELAKALALVRMASKDMECTVSWNHIIDWLMARRDVKAAFRIYNEMKKRAQFPDSHTVLLLLRGLSNPPVHSTDVGQALALYHAMSAPNSKVKRTIIHTNAALKVCARAHDMDSLWSIASRIPERGAGSADNLTFTTILNAIRENAVNDHNVIDVSEEQKRRNREEAVAEGKRIWEDITGKWRTGDVQVDEELVCAMGRLMLIGSRPTDWDDVLSLVEQTMDIPRLAPRLGTETRTAEHLKDIHVIQQHRGELEDADGFVPTNPVGQFDLAKIRRGKSDSAIFAKTSNNTLSVVVEACQKMVAPKIAFDYWHLLTESYNITPDIDNYNMFLRLLRQSRASGKAVELIRPLTVKDIPAIQKPQRKTFRIAMSTCVRDKNNHNVMSHAESILDFMERSIADIDPKTLVMYLDLALHKNSGPTIVSAFERLSPHITNLKSLLAYGNTSNGTLTGSDVQDALLLIKTAIGTIDALMNQGMVPREDYSVWAQRRGKLAAFLTRRFTIERKQKTKADLEPKKPVLEAASVEKKASGRPEDQKKETDETIMSDGPDPGRRSLRTANEEDERNRPKWRFHKNISEEWVQGLRRESAQLRRFKRNEKIRQGGPRDKRELRGREAGQEDVPIQGKRSQEADFLEDFPGETI